ncbi:MAG: glycogen synthase [Bacteroidetes bacterium]|nr:glycogen synthase [Bacteroidota bacterium]
MAKSLNILYVSAEAYPFAKETEVADVTGGLPLTMREYAHDVRVIIPRYACISDRRHKVFNINRTAEVNLKMPSGKDETFTIKSASIANTRYKVQVYVALNQKYFEGRKGIYTDPVKGLEYVDNLERFAFYSRTVVETCELLGWYPDIIHCNDWYTALIPAYIRYYYPNKFKKTKTILTIHNASNQGIFPLKMYNLLGLPEDAKDSFVHKKQLNILKGGMLYANQVTTISETYKKIIAKDKNITHGLNTLINQNYDRIIAINNAVDINYWNPRKDNIIKKKLNKDAKEFKQINKIELCKKLKLVYDENTPIISVITKINAEKDADMLIDAISSVIKNNNLQFVILVKGNKNSKQKITKLKSSYPNNIAVILDFDDNAIHSVNAGADMQLITETEQPSAISFLNALNYGTIPIAHITFGFNDVAIPINKNKINDNSNCFGIKNIANLDEVVKGAIALFNNKKEWDKLIDNVINKDYSWISVSDNYESIYRNVYKSKV